jgi:hypothetical protein
MAMTSHSGSPRLASAMGASSVWSWLLNLKKNLGSGPTKPLVFQMVS